MRDALARLRFEVFTVVLEQEAFCQSHLQRRLGLLFEGDCPVDMPGEAAVGPGLLLEPFLSTLVVFDRPVFGHSHLQRRPGHFFLVLSSAIVLRAH